MARIRLAVDAVEEKFEWMGRTQYNNVRYAVTLNGIEIARASCKQDALREAVSKFSALAHVLEASSNNGVELE